MSSLHLYIAGKVSKNSQFGKHHWRESFCADLAQRSSLNLRNIDPLKNLQGHETPSQIFKQCVKQINNADVVVVYFSDDISVGGSQEVLIAKYLNKPVIGYAPLGGKFNGCEREMFGRVIKDFKDPFVFATCDVVCGTLDEVATSLRSLKSMTIKNLSLINEALE